MKCRVCRGPAVIDVRRHNANFCSEHFLRLCRDQVAKAIRQFDMLAGGDRVLVAVSGGKDSLAVWDVLTELGYAADGFYLAYKAALNDIEVESPGAKHDFYFGFLERASERFRAEVERDRAALAPCPQCGSPTDAGVCAFCRLAERAAAPAPVRFSDRPGR